MLVTLSGLNEQAALARFGDVASDMLQWQPASLFLAEAEMAAAEPQRLWVWLYRAPWAFLAEGGVQDSAAALHQWQAQQRAVLQLRRHLRQGLLLVNADRVQPQLLAERLGITGQVAAEPNTVSPLSYVVAGVFEQLAPECWDIYEALEASAWLPEGSPEFRANREPASSEALPALLDLLSGGNRLAHVVAQLAEHEQELNSVRGHLQQAEQQLEQAAAQQRSLTDELAGSRKATTEAQARNNQLAGDQERLQQQLTDSRTELQTATEESELLLNQLHQVQEELEKHYLDSLGLKEQLAARDQQLEQISAQQKKLTEELTASRKAVSQAEVARQKLADDNQSLQKQLAAEQDAKRKAAAQSDEARRKLENDNQRLQQQLVDSRAEQQSATEESELLLNQLHQVQEELENYYLANREILTSMGQYEHTLHRARRALSQMAAHA